MKIYLYSSHYSQEARQLVISIIEHLKRTGSKGTHADFADSFNKFFHSRDCAGKLTSGIVGGLRSGTTTGDKWVKSLKEWATALGVADVQLP